MKQAMRKDTLREIWRTRNRFLSIFTIVAIGVGFFAGVKATGPDMKHSVDLYSQESRLFDFQLKSTIGFNEDDVAAARALDSVGAVLPSHSVDLLVAGEDSSMVIKVLGIPTGLDESDPGWLNRPSLVEGRLPERSGECVVEHASLTASGFEIGQQITFFTDSSQDDLPDILSRDTYTVVGVVNTPYYLSFDRGSTTIGNGSINSFIMIPEEDFAYEAYTDLYLTVDDAAGLSAFEQPYADVINQFTGVMEDLGHRRSLARYEEIRDEAQEKIDDAKQELADGEEEQRTKLADARKKIDDAKRELADGERELAEKEQEYYDEIAKAEAELEDGEWDLNWAREQLAEGEEEYSEGYHEFQKQKKEALEELSDSEGLVEQLEQVVPELLAVKAQYDALGQVAAAVETAPPAMLEQFAGQLEPLSAELAGALRQLAALDPSDPTYPMMKPALVAGIQQGVAQAQQQMAEQVSQQTSGQVKLEQVSPEYLNALLSKARGQIESGYEQLWEGRNQLKDAEKELDQGRKELADGEQELEDGRKELEDAKAEGLQKINEAKQDIADAKVKIADAEQEYADGKRDSDQEIADAKVKIADAEQELADFEMPEWYVLTRDDLVGYSGFGDDAERIDAIARVFPVFFLLVAALVCLTTMTRMVEEQRTQIGTLKALGYSNMAIASKFLIYGFTASFLGSAAGLAIGFQLFPNVIYNAYGMMYNLPPLDAPIQWGTAIVITMAAVLMTLGTVISSSYRALRAVPAELMRPKAPKNGKRVFLEHITFLWRRLSFSHKVTVRNLMRYKKRGLMTVIGIAGCTALMLTGFGIKDSIGDIVEKQFDEISLYDMTVVVDPDADADDLAATGEALAGFLADGTAQSVMPAYQKSYDALFRGERVELTLFVPGRPERLNEFVVLRERVGKASVPLTDEGVVINEKAASLLGLHAGDTLTLRDSENQEVEVPVTGITENYANHYVYATPALYESVFQKPPEYNVELMALSDDSTETIDRISSSLLQNEAVMMTSATRSIRDQFSDVVTGLNSIVIVLILSAGALAFVVLYNLTNINITERIREIATIKVLGFYDREVSAYIFRENVVLTFLGMFLGLAGGVLLHRFVILTAEIDLVMFGRIISLPSYCLAGVITVLFALIVNWVMYFKLKKVSMVESLKSVE